MIFLDVLEALNTWDSGKQQSFGYFCSILAQLGIFISLFGMSPLTINFLILSVLSHIFVQPLHSKNSTMVNFGRVLCTKFLNQVPLIFGNEFNIFNVHSLIHLADDVERFGSLDSFSCFSFENFNRFIKQQIKSNTFIIQQIVKRVSETNQSLNHNDQQQTVQPYETFFPHTFGPTLSSFSHRKQFKKLVVSDIILKTNGKDCFFMDSRGRLCRVKNILFDSSPYLLCDVFFSLSDAFQNPVASSK